jgi:DNA polymerase-3 subunit alpha
MDPTKNFIQLHNHSYYSLLDGLSSPEDLAHRAKVLGYPSLGISDHGTCGGLLSFQKACNEEGIKPILGMEAYVCEKATEKTGSRYHLCIFAKNKIGIKNLLKLSSFAYIKGFYYKPRIDFETLLEYKEGLIVSSGCCVSELAQVLEQQGYESGKKVAMKYKDAFGDDYYIEVMMHKSNDPNDTEQEDRENFLAKEMIRMAKELNIKAICTNDTHYANAEDAEAHNLLLAVQTHDVIKNKNRKVKFSSNEFYLKSPQEMMEYYHEVPYLLTNTKEIDEKVEKDLIHYHPDLLPEIGLPEGFTSEEGFLKHIVVEGMKNKGLFNNQPYRDRIKFEMEVIIRCKYTKYFLILWDVIRFAKDRKIRTGIGRGSAAGSLVLYVLDIVKLDPIKYNLLFERFLNPERVSPPDVDMDFDPARKDEILNYMITKYGTDNTTSIGTYNAYKTKGTIQNVVKALDLGGDFEEEMRFKKNNPNGHFTPEKRTLRLAMELSKLMPKMGEYCLDDILKTDAFVREQFAKYPRLEHFCKKIEGTLASEGKHAAGIIVCNSKIDDYIPLRLDKDKNMCSQFDKEEVEELGLLKFDMLAIKTLTVVERAVSLVKERHNIEIDIDNLDYLDKNVFMLMEGKLKGIDNRGVFQFESYQMTKLLKQIKVDSFEDVIAANALGRPGPMGAGVPQMYADFKTGRKPITYAHPKMKEILKNTFGLIVYQEDFMKVAQELAGFTKGESDVLRKAVGKKKIELLMAQKEKFVDGCIKNGVSKPVAEKIFSDIEFFGGYGFNRSHSASYGALAYQTAYLKLYYPIEFFASILTIVIAEEDTLLSYIDQARLMNIVVKNPHINNSRMEFVIEKDEKGMEFLRAPFNFIKGVGIMACTNLVKNQPYENFEDFMVKATNCSLSEGVFTSLVDTGAFDLAWPETQSRGYRQKMKDSFGIIKADLKKKANAVKQQEIALTKFSDLNDGKTLFDF